MNEVAAEEGLPLVEHLDFKTFKDMMNAAAEEDGMPPFSDEEVQEYLEFCGSFDV